MRRQKNNINILLCSLILTISALSCVKDSSHGVYYVRMDGDNTNSGIGNSSSQAWATLQYAFNQIKPGDSLYVTDGIYTENELVINGLHSTQDKPTVITTINSWEAIITEDTNYDENTNAVTISNCSFLEFNGFEVYDDKDRGVGITVRDSSHHVIIKNNYVHDCGCNGISSRLSDYITIEDNVVRKNATRSEWNCSGISVWHPLELDTIPGFHITIRNNVAFENECDIPFRPLGHKNPTDGNGIIIDDYRNTQGGGQEGGFTAQSLIENNICFNNGGRGINVYKADNAVVRNNTVVNNLQVLSKYADFMGDITVSNSKNTKVFNNLVIKDPSLKTKAIRFYDNNGFATIFSNNVVIGPVDYCTQHIINEENRIFNIDDQEKVIFSNTYIGLEKFTSAKDFSKYFILTKGSEGINAGNRHTASKYDFAGGVSTTIERNTVGAIEKVQ